MLRSPSLLLLTMAFAGTALAQQPAPPSAAASTCAYQYKDAPGVTPAQLVGRGFEIKTGWPGGLWLQKGTAAYFCNSGRTTERAVICWTLAEPVDGSTCQ
jgi:hypothetical protein